MVSPIQFGDGPKTAVISGHILKRAHSRVDESFKVFSLVSVIFSECVCVFLVRFARSGARRAHPFFRPGFLLRCSKKFANLLSIERQKYGAIKNNPLAASVVILKPDKHVRCNYTLQTMCFAERKGDVRGEQPQSCLPMSASGPVLVHR